MVCRLGPRWESFGLQQGLGKRGAYWGDSPVGYGAPLALATGRRAGSEGAEIGHPVGELKKTPFPPAFCRTEGSSLITDSASFTVPG